MDVPLDNPQGARKFAVAARALGLGLIDERRPVAGFIDGSGLKATIADLKAGFPGHFLHALAVKANAMPEILGIVREAGMGCEVASPGELAAAQAAGFSSARIVFDSPAKTRWEIAEALGAGITINIDNFDELERVDGALARAPSPSLIGIRVNPQVGTGSITAMSTATMTSKFGIGLRDGDNRQRLIEAYRARPWLRALHCHVGSQGCPLPLMVAGVAETVALAQEIDAAVGEPRIATINIGGGLPVNFAGEEIRPSFADYSALLKEGVPALFSGSFQVVTEFGRSLLAKNGFMIARVEYAKTMGGRAIAITHAGAQVAVRTVFMPKAWPLRITALDGAGREKHGALIAQDIAGPCCFAGDIIAHERPLPRLEAGDCVLIHDTGAYYFSTPFHYNSLPPIPVYLAAARGSELELVACA